MDVSSLESPEFLNSVPRGFNFTIGELRAAFDIVANKTNWKFRIDHTMHVPQAHVARMSKIMHESIVFMAGGQARVTWQDGTMHVTAPGYYELIGA